MTKSLREISQALLDNWDAPEWNKLSKRAELMAELRAALGDPTPVSIVRVIPLEWVEHGDRDFVWHRAMSPAGYRYNIEDDGFSEKKHHLTVGQLVLGNFETLKEAQDAAHADYERRILSAIAIGASR